MSRPGSFGCLTAWASEGDDNDEQIPLMSAKITNHDHGQIQ
jgi:hypothetical protein